MTGINVGLNLLILLLVLKILLELRKRVEPKNKKKKTIQPEVLEKQTSKVYSLKKDLDAKMKGKIVDPFD